MIMASTAMAPVEQSQVKPSFAKVAASSYKPNNAKESQPVPKPAVVVPQPLTQPQGSKKPVFSDTNPPKVIVDRKGDKEVNQQAADTAVRSGQWANVPQQQVPDQSVSKREEPEKPRPSITFVKSLANEDSTTQLSSSDGSNKPPSLDGKSVASATTFALDEKESLRPDDSASLRAVEEEDITSPPDSVAAGSRVGSDSGVRAFHDQLHEIAAHQRGAPPGRFPNPSPHTLYDPNQPSNGVGRSSSQPVVVNGMASMAGPLTIPGPDEKLVEALESPRDRLFVLKLEQDFIDFIKDSRENELALPNCNTFYRMLAHRLADYYLLGHTVDDTMTGVTIRRTANCRIPPPLSGIPVSSKNTNTPPVDLPARKIMRRGGEIKSGTNTTANSEGPSKTTSEAGGASGSEGGNDENKDKSALTREEREARYREARQRIFGSESGEGEPSEGVGAVEEKDASRSSSTSGKKKNRKQRNYDDDFEARSRYNAYYPNQYGTSSFGGDQAVYYGAYPGQVPNPQFAGMNANTSPPPTYNSGYPNMIPTEAQNQYGWSGQQFQASNGPMGFPGYGPSQNGYDLSADFQRGMQSFQSAGMPSQITPKMANVPMAAYPDTYQSQPMPMNGGWSQMNQQPPYAMGQPLFPQHDSGNRPISAPIQGPIPTQYPYGQFPPSPYNSKPNRNQHPLPGSYNRQQFNPQSQAFVPGGRTGSYQMQPNLASMPMQSLNGFGGFQGPNRSPNPLHIAKPSPPAPHSQNFESPGSTNSNHAPPAKNATGTPQIANTIPATAQSSLIHSNSALPAQSSIAKWGTPSHLPPKPPAPAQSQPPKFSLPSNNIPPPSFRNSSSITPGFPPNPAISRGGGAIMPNNNPT